MIRFAIRLAVAGGREAATRLILIGTAVMVGAALLLATLAGIHAVNSQSNRYAWLNTSVTAPEAPAGAHSVWWHVRGDYFNRHPIGVVDVAATGLDSPVPPGLPRLPGPGEYYASPALQKLLDATPADQLADRYAGHSIGTIGDIGLPAPNSLIVVIGHSADEMSQMPGAKRFGAIGTIVPGDCDGCPVGTRAAGMDLVLSVVALALLFPVLMFIGTATRLAAARREQRFAAMRLVGATPRQISVISAVESTVAAVIGTAVGFIVFFASRTPLASVPFTGEPFFPADLSLNWIDVLLIALGIPIGAAVAARLGLRKVAISPLGVSRRVTPKPPRAWRLLPLVAGLAELTYFIGRRPQTSLQQTAAFLPGFFVIMAGLVIAGPWLTMVGSRFMALRSRRPATLIAARRLADNPHAGFRAVSGLILALFVTSVAVGVITTITANRGGITSPTGASTLALTETNDEATSMPAGMADALRSTPGIEDVTALRQNPPLDEASHMGRYGELPALVSCADLAAVPAYGHCAPGAVAANVFADLTDRGNERSPAIQWETADITAAQLQQLPVSAIVVGTDGSTAAIERARTILEAAYPDRFRVPATEADSNKDFTKLLTAWQQLANVVILTSLPIAGCSLAVSVAGGLSERKRPFSLLRLTGVPVRVLRRVVALESAVPLLLASAVAIGVGLLAAQIFLKAQMYYTLKSPGIEYYAIVAGGLLASLGIIASTLPLLERITGPETARNE
jgi:FtsX-like permease family